MTWVRVPQSEFNRIRKLAAERKAKREEKRKTLPWGKEKIEPVSILRKKRKKKSPRQAQYIINDNLWSLAVRKRDKHLYGELCRICGKCRPLVGYHLVPKKRGVAIRWHLENGVAGCSPCNFGERQNPSLYRDKHIAIVGKSLVEAIEARARIAAQFTLENLKQIGAWLRAVNEAAPGQEPPRPPACLPPIVAV